MIFSPYLTTAFYDFLCVLCQSSGIFFFIVLAVRRGMQDLSSLTRDQTCIPCSRSTESRGTGPPGNFLFVVFKWGFCFWTLCQVLPEKRNLKLLKSQNINVNWYMYCPEGSVILLSTTVLGNVLQPFYFRVRVSLPLKKSSDNSLTDPVTWKGQVPPLRALPLLTTRGHPIPSHQREPCPFWPLESTPYHPISAKNES